MATKKKVVDKQANTTEPLTKRVLIRAAKAGIRKAAEETMEIMGFTVVAHGGWVVKKYADGRIEKLSKIAPVQKPQRIVLK